MNHAVATILVKSQLTRLTKDEIVMSNGRIIRAVVSNTFPRRPLLPSAAQLRSLPDDLERRTAMKNWFLSLHGAITLSVIALLTLLGRLFLDWRYESHLLGAPGSILETFYVLLFLAFAGGWVWAMLAAIRGIRRGLIACLILALLLNVGSALAMYFSWCPPARCPSFPNQGLWPWTWAQLISGLLAAIALVFQLREKKAAG
jgi:hypothetical protein